MTALDLRLLESSHIRRVLSAEAVRKLVGFLGFHATEVRAATCPLVGRERGQTCCSLQNHDNDSLGVSEVSNVHVSLDKLSPSFMRQMARQIYGERRLTTRFPLDCRAWPCSSQ